MRSRCIHASLTPSWTSVFSPAACSPPSPRNSSSPVGAPQVVHPAGEVIKPDSWRCVNDEGMPVHGRPYEKGNLYIHFTVKFPDELDAGTMDALRKLLPPGAASAVLNGRMETEDIEQARARASRCVQPCRQRAGA